MVGLRRLMGVFLCVLGAAAPADADVVTDWSSITIDSDGNRSTVGDPSWQSSCAMRVARWAYKYYLRSRDGDEFDFVRTLDTIEDINLLHDEEDGQDQDDAEHKTPDR